MLPAPELAADGLGLRPWAFGDIEALEQACGDPDICRFTTVPERYSADAAHAWIERQHERLAEGGIVLAIVPESIGLPVGMVGIFGLGRPARTPRLGYWVIREFRGRGLAVASARMLAGWAYDELGIETLLLDIEPSNQASHRVAAKLGAKRVGEVTEGTVRLWRYELAARGLRRT